MQGPELSSSAAFGTGVEASEESGGFAFFGPQQQDAPRQ